jgi:hypothetical protein
MNNLLRPRIWPSFLASSGVGPYDVPFRYASDSGTPRNQSRGTAGRLPGGTPILFALAALRSVPQAGSQLRGLATAIHEISGLVSLPADIVPGCKFGIFSFNYKYLNLDIIKSNVSSLSKQGARSGSPITITSRNTIFNCYWQRILFE